MLLIILNASFYHNYIKANLVFISFKKSFGTLLVKYMVMYLVLRTQKSRSHIEFIVKTFTKRDGKTFRLIA